MKPEIATIISALISNIGHMNKTNGYSNEYMRAKEIATTKTAEAISILSKNWPNLTDEEKLEIKAVVEAVKTSGKDLPIHL